MLLHWLYLDNIALNSHFSREWRHKKMDRITKTDRKTGEKSVRRKNTGKKNDCFGNNSVNTKYTKYLHRNQSNVSAGMRSLGLCRLTVAANTRINGLIANWKQLFKQTMYATANWFTQVMIWLDFSSIFAMSSHSSNWSSSIIALMWAALKMAISFVDYFVFMSLRSFLSLTDRMPTSNGFWIKLT